MALATAFTLVATVVTGTELRIHLERPGPREVPVIVDRAELLLVAWGDTERIQLRPDIEAGQLVFRVPLDMDWLADRWARSSDMIGAYIFMHSTTRASIRSKPFRWLDAHDRSGASLSQVDIDFGQGQAVTVRRGETRDIVLNFREPEPRQVRFLDETNKPVTDVTISAYMFWSRSNHCGVLAGADPLVERLRPNADGIVTLPDGDFEYAIRVIGRHLSVKDPSADEYEVITTYLTTAERVIRIRRHARYSVSVRVLVGDRPAVGAELGSTSTSCPCGACSGSAGVLDADGRITIPDFYPDELVVCLADEAGKQVWSLQPQPAEQTVSLPEGTKLGAAGYCEGKVP